MWLPLSHRGTISITPAHRACVILYDAHRGLSQKCFAPPAKPAKFFQKVLDLFNNLPYHIYRLGSHSMAHKIGQPKIPKS